MEAQNKNNDVLEEDYLMDIQPVKDQIPMLSINLSDRENELNLKTENSLIQEKKPFIEANTLEVNLAHLKNDCIIPVFSKDNEKTIAHQEFIEITYESISKVFPHHPISKPEIRVSHTIKGRTPEAIYKNAKDLLDHEKTQYFERMAFIFNLPSITSSINGNKLDLTIGGVRAYNLENLYNRKTMEKFKFFIGFQNKVCMNLCVWSDGYVEDLRVGALTELQQKITEVIQQYDAEKHLDYLRDIGTKAISERQFAQLIGKTRLYQFLPKNEKANLPVLLFNDGHITTIAKEYYQDESFSRDELGNINLWNLYNLFTSANKSSYIDTFLDRGANALDFVNGLKNALNGDLRYRWFLE